MAYARLNQVDARIDEMADRRLLDDADGVNSFRRNDSIRDSHLVLPDRNRHIGGMLAMEIEHCPEVDGGQNISVDDEQRKISRGSFCQRSSRAHGPVFIHIFDVDSKILSVMKVLDDAIRQLELPFDAFRELHRYCRDRGILFLSTPFDYESAGFLAALPVPAFKVPSGEITNLFFLEYIARKGLPLIVSTGMATMEEVAIAVDTIRVAGNQQIVLLQCVSNYPSSPSSMNLRAMRTLEEAFGVAAGLSDHTVGTEVALAAVALGACVIEKHFTLSQELPGPDHRASLEPQDLMQLVKGIRSVESALGDGIKRPAEEELNTAAVARRSLVAAKFIPAGAVLTLDLLDILRPGTGLPPAMRSQVVGRQARHDIEAGTILRLDMLA